MAGTKEAVEGLPDFYASVLLAASGTPTDSLQGIRVSTFDVPGSFVGFTAADARVNAKGNINAGVLVSETPIVP